MANENNEKVCFADLGLSGRALVFAGGFMLLVLATITILLQTGAKQWFYKHEVWHSVFVDGPVLIAAIIAYFELGHSGEANVQRRRLNDEVSGLRGDLATANKKAEENQKQANEYFRQMNELEKQNVDLRERLAKATEQIAENTKRPLTKEERNATTLRKYIGEMAAVFTDGAQPVGWEIAEVDEDNILTLFIGPGVTSLEALSSRVECGELSIDETPESGCRIKILVNKFLGRPSRWGQAKRWSERHGAAAGAPSIDRGDTVWHASYTRGGETKTLRIFQAKDGTNLFQLEGDGQVISVGDNVDVSKHWMIRQIDFYAANFGRGTSGTGAIKGEYRLHIC